MQMSGQVHGTVRESMKFFDLQLLSAQRPEHRPAAAGSQVKCEHMERLHELPLPWNEEHICRLTQPDPSDEKRELAGMVVAPHGGLTGGGMLPLRDVVPSVWAVVDRMEEKSLMIRTG